MTMAHVHYTDIYTYKAMKIIYPWYSPKFQIFWGTDTVAMLVTLIFLVNFYVAFDTLFCNQVPL